MILVMLQVIHRSMGYVTYPKLKIQVFDFTYFEQGFRTLL